MPAAKIFFDLASRRLFSDTQTQLAALDAKSGSKRKYELGIIDGDQVQDLPDTTLVKVAIKDPENLGGGFLAQADAARSGSGSFARWFLLLDLNTVEMAARMGNNSSPISLAFEIVVTFPDGQITKSITIPFVVENTLVRGDEADLSSVDIVTHNNTGTATFQASRSETIYNDGSITLASLTLHLPTVTLIGQICRYVTKVTVTSVTVTGTIDIGAAVTSLSANSAVAWKAIDTVGTFIRIQ